MHRPLPRVVDRDLRPGPTWPHGAGLQVLRLAVAARAGASLSHWHG